MPHQPHPTSSRISLLLFLSDSHGCRHVLVHMWFSSAHPKMNPFPSSIKLFSDATKGRFKPHDQFSADVPSFLSTCSFMLMLTVSDWILTETQFPSALQKCGCLWKWKLLSHVQLFETSWNIQFGILEARILEWVAFPFSRGSSQPKDRMIELRYPTLPADSLPAESQRKPKNTGVGSLSILQWIFPTQE